MTQQVIYTIVSRRVTGIYRDNYEHVSFQYVSSVCEFRPFDPIENAVQWLA